MWKHLENWSTRLAGRRAPWVLLASAAVLSLAAVGPRLSLDDYVLGVVAAKVPRIFGLHQDSFNLFTFTDGEPRNNWKLMDQGFLLPWWTDDRLKISFYRPLSSLTHRVDFALFRNSVSAMYLHSVAWFVLLLAIVLVLYRQLETKMRVAGLAFFAYALDDAHAPAIAWLSNRNALIACAFGVLALVLHDRARRHRSLASACFAPLALGLGLLAGEFAVGAIAYLGAYALFLDDRPVLRRWLALAPHAAVLVAWRAVYQHMGFGSQGSGAYLDPVHERQAFFGALPQKLVALLGGVIGGPPSDLAFFAPPEHRPWLLGVAALSVLLAVWLFTPLARTEALARFWAVGALLSAVPICASFPSDRLLFFVGLGTMPLFARCFDAVLARASGGARSSLRERVVFAYAVLHLAIAPVAFPVRALQMQVIGRTLDKANESLPRDERAARQTFVVLAAPVDVLASYVQAQRAFLGQVRPEHLYWLASATSEVTVTRANERALDVEPAEGYLYTPLERHYRGRIASLGVGDTVALSRMTARVAEVLPDGRPRKVRFTFDERLDDPSYVFVRWQGDHYVPIDLPEVGASLRLPREDFGKILAAKALFWAK